MAPDMKCSDLLYLRQQWLPSVSQGDYEKENKHSCDYLLLLMSYAPWTLSGSKGQSSKFNNNHVMNEVF